MKVNFEKLIIYTDIAKKNKVESDVKEGIADAMYQHGHGIASHALALKIYNSQGDCELTEQEYAILMEFVNNQCTPMVIDAFQNLRDNDNSKE